LRKVIVKPSLSFAALAGLKGSPALLEWTLEASGKKVQKGKQVLEAYPPIVPSHFAELNLPSFQPIKAPWSGH